MASLWFEKEGPENTDQTLAAALEAARSQKLTHIVIATTSGETARKLGELTRAARWNGKIVAVSHAWGFREKGKNSLSEETRAALTASGITVISATHVLSGVERALSTKFQGVNPVEIIAHSLRLLGQGTKVAVEISSAALDAGALPWGQEVVAIAGTRTGADTAVVIRPDYSANLFDSRIRQYLAKPL